MEIVFLGTGGSWPSKERNVSGIAIRLNREIILFDCGEGTQRQLMNTQVSFMKITKIFISHFHGDHFLGLPGLVQSMAFNNRKETLEIYGPKGTSIIISELLKLGYFSPDFKIKLYDLNPNELVDFKSYIIRTFALDHNTPTFAYILEEKARVGKFNLSKAKALGIPPGPLYRKLQTGKSIVFKGRKILPSQVLGKPRKGRKIVYANDTRPCNGLCKFAKGCDVLIHDATVSTELEKKANSFGHSSARQAAEIARKAKAKLLFLIHFSPRYKKLESLEEEARKIFKNTIAACDFMVYRVKGK
jgi:ribonuclease Z